MKSEDVRDQIRGPGQVDIVALDFSGNLDELTAGIKADDPSAHPYEFASPPARTATRLEDFVAGSNHFGKQLRHLASFNLPSFFGLALALREHSSLQEP